MADLVENARAPPSEQAQTEVTSLAEIADSIFVPGDSNESS